MGPVAGRHDRRQDVDDVAELLEHGARPLGDREVRPPLRRVPPAGPVVAQAGQLGRGLVGPPVSRLETDAHGSLGGSPLLGGGNRAGISVPAPVAVRPAGWSRGSHLGGPFPGRGQLALSRGGGRGRRDVRRLLGREPGPAVEGLGGRRPELARAPQGTVPRPELVLDEHGDRCSSAGARVRERGDGAHEHTRVCQAVRSHVPSRRVSSRGCSGDRSRDAMHTRAGRQRAGARRPRPPRPRLAPAPAPQRPSVPAPCDLEVS